MAKLAIDRDSIVFGKISGDFHSKSGDREIFIILSKIGRSPEKSGDLEALDHTSYYYQQHLIANNRRVKTCNDSFMFLSFLSFFFSQIIMVNMILCI